MGDAGSRAMGFFIAILSLKCGHPFAFLLAAIVFIVDGSLGILKISLKRFLHISILKNTRTPLHDHVRKNKLERRAGRGPLAHPAVRGIGSAAARGAR